MFNNFLFENRAVYEIIWKKNVVKAQAGNGDDSAHALCILNAQGHKHTLRICNTYCFSTVTMLARTRLSVTVCAHCLSGLDFLLHRYRVLGFGCNFWPFTVVSVTKF